MMKIRSAIFKTVLILWWVLFYVGCSPLLLILKPKHIVVSVQLWGKFVACFLLRWIGGIKIRVTGLEHIPEGKYIVASKHQSELETLVLGYSFSNPVFVIKKELAQLPFFGWFMRKAHMIAVDRKAKGKTMQQMLDKAVPATLQGSHLIIFPEGTRVQMGDYKKFKMGIGLLYEQTQVPVVPVATNAGLFWSVGKLHRTGVADVEFMEPIQPGLPLDEFMEKLEKTILTRSAELNHKVLN